MREKSVKRGRERREMEVSERDGEREGRGRGEIYKIRAREMR